MTYARTPQGQLDELEYRTTRAATEVRCPECGRVFDLLDSDEAEEWAYGHDCEVEE